MTTTSTMRKGGDVISSHFSSDAQLQLCNGVSQRKRCGMLIVAACIMSIYQLVMRSRQFIWNATGSWMVTHYSLYICTSLWGATPTLQWCISTNTNCHVDRCCMHYVHILISHVQQPNQLNATGLWMVTHYSLCICTSIWGKTPTLQWCISMNMKRHVDRRCMAYLYGLLNQSLAQVWVYNPSVSNGFTLKLTLPHSKCVGKSIFTWSKWHFKEVFNQGEHHHGCYLGKCRKSDSPYCARL
jgi:hypothetical protein